MVHVQAPLFSCREHPALCPPVPEIRNLLPRSGGDDAGARLAVNPSTLFRWVQRYAPELEKRVRAHQGSGSTSWRIDETYIRVGGQWKYLFRAVEKHGLLIDFLRLDRRNTRAAHRFLSKAATAMRNWPPSSISTDKEQAR
jgi:transposase-like protein